MGCRASPPPAAPRSRASACLLWGAVSIGTRGYLAGPPTPPSRTSVRCAPLWPTHPPSDVLSVGAAPPRPRRISARGVTFAGAPNSRWRTSGSLAPRVRAGVRAFRRLPGEKAPRAHRSSEGERVSPMGGAAPHTPIPEERALRAAQPLSPPTRPRMFFLWGLRPHAPAGSAAPPKPRGRSGPLSPGERVGVRAHRGCRDASDLSLAACLSSFDGVCGSRAGAWGAAPTENAIEGGCGGRASARARPTQSRHPGCEGARALACAARTRGRGGRSPPQRKKSGAGGWGAARSARSSESELAPRPRGRASPRETDPSAARARYRRGSSLRLENCRRPAVRSPGCGSPAARTAATAARPARARKGSRGTGPRLRRTAT